MWILWIHDPFLDLPKKTQNPLSGFWIFPKKHTLSQFFRAQSAWWDNWSENLFLGGDIKKNTYKSDIQLTSMEIFGKSKLNELHCSHLLLSLMTKPTAALAIHQNGAKNRGHFGKAETKPHKELLLSIIKIFCWNETFNFYSHQQKKAVSFHVNGKCTAVLRATEPNAIVPRSKYNILTKT